MRSHEHRDQTILVIEPDSALRRIMALGLLQRGFQVLEARSLGDAWDLATAVPAAVVLDVSLGPNSEWMLLRTLRTHRLLGAAPLVLLAWDCPTDAALAGERTTPCVCLSKPFDARALLDAVETVLVAPVGALLHAFDHQSAAAQAPALDAREVAGGSGAAANGAEVTAADVSAHAAPTAPTASIWPLVTAAGATLTVAGFLIHPAVMVVGIVIICAALVLWLGETIEPAPSA